MSKKNKELRKDILEERKKQEIMKCYEEIEERYKKIIEEKEAKNEKNINEKNLLAFTHYNMGKVDEAKNELEELIRKYDSYTAYRQIIYIEHQQGNLDTARLWAYECLDRFPKNTSIQKCVDDLEKEAE